MTVADILLVAIGIVYAVKFFKENKNINFKTFIKGRKAQIVFLGIYAICLLGLINTSNLSFGLKDLNIKLPLLFFPLVFLFLPEIKNSTIKKIITIHCFALIIASLVVLYNTIFSELANFRNFFPYISHIRLSLNYCASIYFLLYNFFTEKNLKTKQKVVIIFIVAWFITILCIMKSATGISIIVLLFCFIVLSRNFFKTLSKKLRNITIITLVSVILICIGFFAFSYIKYYKISSYELDNLPKYTINGNEYSNDISKGIIEEGDNYRILICEKEMRKEWNSRSNIAYDSIVNGTSLKSTLIRYLNSLDYTKDSLGVWKLTEEQIHDVEHGYANYYYKNNIGFYSRMSMFFFSYETYKKTGNPSGSTLFQRLYFWKAGLILVKEYPLFGVGTGDVRDELNKVYIENFPELKSNYYYSTHNQYLYFAIANGLIGLIIFVFCLIYPGVIKNKANDYYWRFFLILIMLSMLTEDTLSTQAGITLFVFFYFVFLFREKNEKPENTKIEVEDEQSYNNV
ncbi:MAG: O-antigen ligase family protein [Bacteroidales bacterium]|nr:O-antigen ligase family protein [Bacteroidales bacterium]